MEEASARCPAYAVAATGSRSPATSAGPVSATATATAASGSAASRERVVRTMPGVEEPEPALA